MYGSCVYVHVPTYLMVMNLLVTLQEHIYKAHNYKCICHHAIMTRACCDYGLLQFVKIIINRKFAYTTTIITVILYSYMPMNVLQYMISVYY